MSHLAATPLSSVGIYFRVSYSVVLVGLLAYGVVDRARSGAQMVPTVLLSLAAAVAFALGKPHVGGALLGIAIAIVLIQRRAPRSHRSRAKGNMTGPELATAAADLYRKKSGDDRNLTAMFLSGLDSSSSRARAKAIKALGTLRATAAVPKLRLIAEHDEEGWARHDALFSLGQIDGPASCELFTRSLTDSYWGARLMAAKGLQEFGDPTALEPLRNARSTDHFYWRWVYSRAIRHVRNRPQATSTQPGTS